MRASHREVRKKILDRMSKIDDKEFFTSRAYRGYLADITESATKRYHRRSASICLQMRRIRRSPIPTTPASTSMCVTSLHRVCRPGN